MTGTLASPTESTDTLQRLHVREETQKLFAKSCFFFSPIDLVNHYKFHAKNDDICQLQVLV